MKKLDMKFLQSRVDDVADLLAMVPAPSVEAISQLLSIQGALLQREAVQMVSDASHLEGNRALLRLEAAAKLASAATSSYMGAGSLMLSLEKAQISADLKREKVLAEVRKKALIAATRQDKMLFEDYVAARRVAVGRDDGSGLGRPARDVQLEPGVEKWLELGENNVLG